MGKKKPSPTQNIINQSQTAYQNSLQPSAAENEMTGVSSNFMNNYNQATGQNMADYTNMMGEYGKFREGLGGPSSFSFNKVSANRPAELGKAYGYLDEAAPGYSEFAKTGGYSPTDIQELRARGMSPIRSAYGNTMMEMDRARSIGGAGGTPNYIAAASKAQRELPGQLADSMTTVNASLADAIRQGRQFGLGGLTQTGATMGGLASDEAGRDLQAQMSNQGADLQAQGMGEQSLQNLRGNQLQSLSGQGSLYGTSPGLSSTFGNQVLNAYQTRASMEQNRNQFGLGALDAQLRAQSLKQQEVPWWQKALGIAGTVVPFMGGFNNLLKPKPQTRSFSAEG